MMECANPKEPPICIVEGEEDTTRRRKERQLKAISTLVSNPTHAQGRKKASINYD